VYTGQLFIAEMEREALCNI